MSVMCFCAVFFERHTRRLVVDCGRPSVVAIFSWPTPAIFSMAKSSSAERDHSRSEHTPEHVGCETIDAVVLGVGVLCTVVCRCEM